MRTIPLLIAMFMTPSTTTSPQNDGGAMELVHVQRAPHGEGPAPLLLLLHGYGSNERDLFSWADRTSPEWMVISVRGPLALGGDRFAWYPVNMQEGRIVIDPKVEAESRAAVLALIDRLVHAGSVDPQRIVVAGFSQGANLAETIALTNPDRVAGFGVFSGRFVEEIRPSIKASAELARLKAFVSHGTGDQMLPVAHAEANKRELQQLGIAITYAEDNTAHTISASQLAALVEWLKAFTGG